MECMNTQDRSVINTICFEETGAIAVGRNLGVPMNNITVYVQAAYEALGDAISRMRDFKKRGDEEA